jgi:hypothetical protein
MPIHDWTKVAAGIFHSFHHDWISEISRALNRGVLPDDYYALSEQYASSFGPDVLTLKGPGGNGDGSTLTNGSRLGGNGGLLALPKLQPIAETEMEFYRRKQKVIVVRHVSDDDVVAIIEIVSPGNKSGRRAIRAFIEKAAELLDKGVHLLIIDLFPPGRRDPQGIHAEIWQEITGEEPNDLVDPRLTLASYETAGAVRAYVVRTAVGGILTDMPLFLETQRTVTVPLEATYNAAFAEVPRRWRQVLEPST